MSPFEKIDKVVSLHSNGMSSSDVVNSAKLLGLSKMQMTRVSTLTGIDKDLFWQAEKVEPFPDNYWSLLNDAIANPEAYENNLVVTPEFTGNY